MHELDTAAKTSLYGDLGTARFIKFVEEMEGLIEPGIGALIGTFFNKNTKYDVKVQESGHLISIASTRSGKGASQIVPTLLTWDKSVFVLDIKSENWKITSGFRSKVLNQRICKIAPFEEDSISWNPLDCVVKAAGESLSSPKAEDEASKMVDLMFSTQEDEAGSDNNVYFIRNAKVLMRALILYVVEASELNDSEQHLVREKTISEVRRLLHLESESQLCLFDKMKSSNFRRVREAANLMLGLLNNDSGKTFAGILSTAQAETDIWSSHNIEKMTRFSEFDFSDLRNNRTSIYLCIPPSEIDNYKSFLRVVLGCAIRQLTLNHNTLETSKDNSKEILFILDEFPQLKYMEVLERGVSYLAGYGIKLWFFVQSIGQLEKYYGETWQNFISNCHTRCFYGIKDLKTAELVSNMIGDATVRYKTSNQNYTKGRNVQKSETNSYSETYGESISSADNIGDNLSRNSSSSYSHNSGESIGPTSSKNFNDGYSSSLSNGKGVNMGQTFSEAINSSNTQGHSVSDSKSINESDSYGINETIQARKLLKPEETFKLPDTVIITFFTGKNPCLLVQKRYFENKNLHLRSEFSPHNPKENEIFKIDNLNSYF